MRWSDPFVINTGTRIPTQSANLPRSYQERRARYRGCKQTGELLYSEDLSPSFSVGVQDGILLDTERSIGFKIEHN